ncbi:uncharacterized protein PAN0_009c3875 [Moesziomyces antarcticus]|uniref:Uncharacterized protein n=2 Tax=Pseudozyma antarctica TaxID=84753 RepID=A0A081CG61_PSEA2|nr:uncharacterized protein PAN0_009c3875 [Moesziomyces antarcticus]GAK65657.1 conserved hypothetical protein [Moesziomyces antarcticus]SPO46675.1 uncharacterized protein PSANT_04361 [Moesziomyces antarcticus]
MGPIGPQLPGPSRPRSPSHSSSSSSRSPPRRAVAGPQLPANFTRSRSNSVSSDDIGPSLPSSSSQPDSSGLNEGARLFLEREARRTAAAESARLAAEQAANSRPEWMLVPPSLSNSSLQAVAGDPLNLKSRGFAQSTPRVSARASGSGTAEVDSSWTETPQQRMERMRAQVTGSHPAPADADELERERTARRDAHIAAQVQDARQSTSLVQQHIDRRKRDMQRQLEDPDDSRRERRHRDRDSHRSSESRRDRDRDRHRHHRRDRSRSPRGRDEERRHSRRDERDERHKERKSSRSSRSGDKEREEKKSRKQREEDDVRAGKAAAPMLWDRDAALSIGGRLMDEKQRGKLIADASALGDRFGSGSRRFL